MSDLLTHDEYDATAAALNLPRSAFIDGRFQPGKGGTLDAINPATGETLCSIAACNSDDVDLAVAKAREAFNRATGRVFTLPNAKTFSFGSAN